MCGDAGESEAACVDGVCEAFATVCCIGDKDDDSDDDDDDGDGDRFDSGR